MSCKENFNSIITFSLCTALTNKILAIIFSIIKLGIYLICFLFLKNWYKEAHKLEAFSIFQFAYEIIILFTSVFMLIFSKYLNRKWIYRILRIHTIIITIYLFFICFIDICIFARIRYKEFPDLYKLSEDPIFNYTDTDELSYSLEKFIDKETKKINISKINDDIFKFTYLEKNNNQIYVPDPQYFQIFFINKPNNELMPDQIRHEFEFYIAMGLQLILIILDILSFFLWNSIKFKHKKLIQNKVIKKYGRKIIYAGYGRISVFGYSHDKEEEEMAIKEIRKNEDFIPETDVEFSCLVYLMEFIVLYGALIVFITLIILKIVENFTTKALHFPFSLTYMGKDLYLNLLKALIVSFGIYLVFLSHIDIVVNHNENKDNDTKKSCGGGILFSFGLAYLFFSIYGILGSLFFIVGDLDSNGKIYIKTACIDSNISCYGLFQFASSFPKDNEIYSKIIYYIYIKKISKSNQAENMASLIAILLIYFCQFYLILFNKMFNFNCDIDRYGKCEVNNYIINDDSKLYLIDNINVNIDDNNNYYRNDLNDSYFKI